MMTRNELTNVIAGALRLRGHGADILPAIAFDQMLRLGSIYEYNGRYDFMCHSPSYRQVDIETGRAYALSTDAWKNFEQTINTKEHENERQ